MLNDNDTKEKVWFEPKSSFNPEARKLKFSKNSLKGSIFTRSCGTSPDDVGHPMDVLGQSHRCHQCRKVSTFSWTFYFQLSSSFHHLSFHVLRKGSHVSELWCCSCFSCWTLKQSRLRSTFDFLLISDVSLSVSLLLWMQGGNSQGSGGFP